MGEEEAKNMKKRGKMMKTLSKISIESDAWSRLKTIRSGVVYDSALTFVYELIQNCQRAGATEVEMKVEDDYFGIYDNGRGCKNPKDLFTMDYSGFGVGYGIGFTSVYPIADRVYVRTLDWSAGIDIERAIEEKDLSLEIAESPFVRGFELVIRGEKIRALSESIKEKIEEAASIIPDMDIYLNGRPIEKVDLFEEPEGTPYHLKASNRIYEGRLVLASNPYESNFLDVYYEHRHVCKIYVEGLSGNILIHDGKVKLKAPDRKSIIYDERRERLMEQIQKDAEELCKMVVRSSEDEDKKKYADTIDRYLGVENYIRYLMMDDNEFKNQYEMRDEAARNEEKTEEGSEEQEESQESYAFDPDNSRMEPDQHFQSYVSAPWGTEEEKNQQITISNIRKKRNVVWVEKEEAEHYEEQIAKYAYYGIYTFKSPHILYDRALTYLDIPHIQDVEARAIEKDYKVVNTGARSNRERRIMQLLQFIERKLGIGEAFYLSDIDCRMTVRLRESKLYQEKLDVEGYEQGGRIHLNRKSLDYGNITSSDWKRSAIGINDIKFVLSNLVLLAHEISHLYGTKDNTVAHYLKQDEIQKKIGQFFQEEDRLF